MTVIELLEQKSKTLMGVESIMQRWHLGRSNDAEALESISELLKSVELLSFFNKDEGETKPPVSGSFKHSMLDVWAFAEWTGKHYIRLHECWVHRFADQRNKDNWKDTGELWKLWWENYR